MTKKHSTEVEQLRLLLLKRLELIVYRDLEVLQATEALRAEDRCVDIYDTIVDQLKSVAENMYRI